MITNRRNKDCITFHFFFIPNGSEVLSMRYASLAFHQIKERVNIGL